MNPDRFRRVANNILLWFAKNKRTHLPWRNTTDPYQIWVSEIMLQQTQADRVIAYYQRFLKKFPTVKKLAQAQWADVLPYWDGLGFYRRGQNMLKCAQVVVQQYDGQFPDDKDELQKLPGIGPYTAAAICSFAFGQNIPAIDTNLQRIIQRVFGCTLKTISTRAEKLFSYHPEQNKFCHTEALERIDKTSEVKDFSAENQQNSSKTLREPQGDKNFAAQLNAALMDIGSTICKAKRVQCEICPLQGDCHFLQSGQKDQWETSLLQNKAGKITRSKKPRIEVACACIHDGQGKYLICQRPGHKGGTWEFAGGKRERGEDWRHCCKREVDEELQLNVSVRPHFYQEVWEEGEFLWDVRFFRCQILGGTPTCIEHQRIKWVPVAELEQYEFPSANQHAITKLKVFKQ